jgi:glycosyltransferase involved in cell wall biosynthesis
MPAAVEQFDLSAYDVVVSSNHAFAKGVITRPDQMHVCYIHTPIRYAWELQHEYLRQAKLTRGLKGMLVRAILHYLRAWDRMSADRVDAFIANSHYIARRVGKTYRRPAHVIYPPVDVDSFTLHESKEDFYLAASRMVPYKRIDLIVEAFAQMPDRHLVVIGDGSEYEKIAAKATPNVALLGYQRDEVLRDYMQRARAFLFAAEEDFGIMPVEAQACGTPVIAYGCGGATETVINGQTGLFFQRQSASCIRDAVTAFDSVRRQMHPELIRANAHRFGPARFRREISELVDRLWAQSGGNYRPARQVAPSDAPFPLDAWWDVMEPARLDTGSNRTTDRPWYRAPRRSRATAAASLSLPLLRTEGQITSPSTVPPPHWGDIQGGVLRLTMDDAEVD